MKLLHFFLVEKITMQKGKKFSKILLKNLLFMVSIPMEPEPEPEPEP